MKGVSSFRLGLLLSHQPHPGFLQGRGVAYGSRALESCRMKLGHEVEGIFLRQRDQKPSGGLRVESDLDEPFANRIVHGDLVFEIFTISLAASREIALFSEVARAAKLGELSGFHNEGHAAPA